MRADKARNQETVLAATGLLFDAASDPDEVSMDAVAAAAGVGKGTVFRGFGDRLGLIRALYDQRSSAFEAELRQTQERSRETSTAGAVHLLLSHLWRFKERNRMLALALDRAGYDSPFRNESYERAHHELLRLLSGADEQVRTHADFLAHALLAAVRSDLVEHLRGETGDGARSDAQAGLRVLVDRLLSLG